MNITRRFFRNCVRSAWNFFKKYSILFGLFTLATETQIPSPNFLNNRAVQATRFKLARRTLEAKRRRQKHELTFLDPAIRFHLDHLRKFGYTLVPNFLSGDCLNEIRQYKDADYYSSPLFKQFSLRGAEYIDADLDEVMPVTAEFLRSQPFSATLPLLYLCKAKLASVWRFKCVKDLETGRDANCTNHSDTFHNTLKMWIYLDDVSRSEDGLKFWKGSHLANEHLDELRLQETLKGNGSPRIPSEVLRSLNLELLDVDIAFNTLVLADTHGFHYRNYAPQKQRWRKSIFCSFRANPFF